MRFYTRVIPRLFPKDVFKSCTAGGLSPFLAVPSIFIHRYAYSSKAVRGLSHHHDFIGRGKGKSKKGESEILSVEEVIRMIKSPNSPNMASSEGQLKMGDQQQQQKPNRGKRPFQDKSKLGQKRENKRNQKKARKRERDMTTGSVEEVLAIDVKNLIESLKQDEDSGAGEENEASEPVAETLPQEGFEIDVEVVELSSTGEGLALQKGSKRVYVVPFSVPGDTVKVKVYRHLREEGYTVADFISVVTPSNSRDDSRIRCQYFSKCSGCQFQMLDYATQLQHKKRIVEKAFRHFSQLPPELIPAIQDTIGSPLQYGYRTKLTPHFDGPQGWRRGKQPFEKCPPIGFMPKGKRDTMDIEDCPIGTDAVRLGMKRERARMRVEYGKYTRGATILLRESTKRIRKNAQGELEETGSPPPPEDAVIRVETDDYVDLKTCVTDNNGMSTEYVGPFVFHNPAGSFFQNNNSILPVFTDYIRQHILPPSSFSSTTTTSSPDSASTASPQIKYLIDAYSGSGLFTITLSSLFPGGSIGIDISDSSIAYASRNAAANASTQSAQARFLAADAKSLFTPAVRSAYAPDETVVVLDPPRKGCDADFLRQLLEFAPRRVVYVSCNVHTQARDVGVLVRGLEEQTKEKKVEEGMEAEKEEGPDQEKAATEAEGGGKGKKTRYAIESLRGFDFFPQTGHVEGVAVLNRVDD
ncbi:S-adenosyl-L-methionine-dependent methyltransferase [Hypomontagnella monticulosa]|nr:S-adenosyl-L-methionine-dependent methyltransferase [Hypomontagnella monticulosa]